MLRNSFLKFQAVGTLFQNSKLSGFFLQIEHTNFFKAWKYLLESMNYAITSINSLSDHLALKVYIILNKSFAITNYWKDCVWKSRFHFGNFIVLNSYNELMNVIAPCEFSILYVFCSILVKRSKLLCFAILHIRLMCKNHRNSFRFQKSCYGIVYNFLENIYPWPSRSLLR